MLYLVIKIAGNPENTKVLWVPFPSHLVFCYIVLPLVTPSNKGKNKGKN